MAQLSICLEQVVLKTEWACKRETSEGGNQEIYDNPVGVPSFSGSDWIDCVQNNSHLGASLALWDSGKEKALTQKLWLLLPWRNVGRISEDSWRKVCWSDETIIEPCLALCLICRSSLTYKSHRDAWRCQHHAVGMLEGKMNIADIKRNPWRKTSPCQSRSQCSQEFVAHSPYSHNLSEPEQFKKINIGENCNDQMWKALRYSRLQFLLKVRLLNSKIH